MIDAAGGVGILHGIDIAVQVLLVRMQMQMQSMTEQSPVNQPALAASRV